jgi:hypothetical protein
MGGEGRAVLAGAGPDRETWQAIGDPADIDGSRRAAYLATTIGEVACTCDTESVELTRWAVNDVGSCGQVPESRLVCFRQHLGTASHPRAICCRHIGQSVSTWDRATRAGDSTRAEAGIVLSFLALMSTVVTLRGMVK